MSLGGGSQTSTVQNSLDPAIQQRLEPFLKKADTALDAPYQPYTGSRVAGFTPDQNAAFQTVRGVANAGTGALGTATDWMRQAATKDSAAAAVPFFSAANSVSAAQSAQPYFNAASNLAARSAGTPYFDAALGDSSLRQANENLTRAGNMSSTEVAAPWLGAGANIDAASAANPLVMQGVNNSSAGAANPYLAAGTRGFTQSVGDYMSPYTSGVVDEIARRGGRNLSENLLPAVNQTFTGAGQFGSSRNADFTARAVRDANESIMGQQAQALESGYKTAADIYGQDAARQLQAGQTAGQLTSTDASRALEGGLGIGNLTNQNAARWLQAGQTLGQLTNADADRLAQIGATKGALSNADLDRVMRAGESQIGATNADANRMSQMGESFGQLTDADQQRTIGIGNALAGYAGDDAARQLQAANALASAAQQGQAMNYTNAAALQGIGQQQQALNQANLDTAYGDFREQRAYPQDQLNWYSSLLRGTPQASSQTSTSPSPSMLSQLGGLGMTGISLIGATGGFGKGGWLGFREGGMVKRPRKMARGGLAHYAAGGMTDGDDDDLTGLSPSLSPASMAAERGYRDAIKGLMEKYETPQRSDFEKWLPGLTGGLGLMAGQSSNPWANLAQSGMGALQMYGQQRKEDRADRQTADKLRVDLAKADLNTALKRDALAAKSASPWVFPGMETPGAVPPSAMPAGAPAPAAKVSPGIPDYEQYAPFINAAAQKFGMDPSVIRGVISMESAGNAGAVSPKGAMGLMQLMPGTYEEVAKEHGLGADANDPENNILAGTAYLAKMRDRYGGDLAKALAAYNAGPGGFEKAGGNFAALPAETQGYLRKAAGLGLVDPAAFGAAPRAQAADAGGDAGVRYVRPINQRTGKMAEFEVPIINGKPDMSRARPAQESTLFSGTSIEGQALNKLVADGKITREQALAWAAGKTVAGPNGQLDFVTPTAAAGATGTMPAPGAAAGATPSGAGGVQSIRPGQLAPKDKEEILEADEVAASSQNAIKALTDALALNDKAYAGALANERAFISRHLPGASPRGEATTMMNNIIGEQALSQLKTIFGGNPTEGERKVLLDLQASVEKSPEERKAIIERAIGLAQSRTDRARQKSQSLREGSYYSPNRQPAQVDVDPLGIR